MLIPSQLSPKYPSAHLLHSGNPVKPSAHLSHLIPITLEDLQEHFPFKSQVWSTDPSTLHLHANNYNTNPIIYDSIFLLFSVLDFLYLRSTYTDSLEICSNLLYILYKNLLQHYLCSLYIFLFYYHIVLIWNHHQNIYILQIISNVLIMILPFY